MNEYNLLCISYLFTDYLGEKYSVKICGKTFFSYFFFRAKHVAGFVMIASHGNSCWINFLVKNVN